MVQAKPPAGSLPATEVCPRGWTLPSWLRLAQVGSRSMMRGRA